MDNHVIISHDHPPPTKIISQFNPRLYLGTILSRKPNTATVYMIRSFRRRPRQLELQISSTKYTDSLIWSQHSHSLPLIEIDVFKHFEKGGQFYSIPGQMTHAITGMYNLYRASELMFPEEHILADARKYTGNFLHQRRITNTVVDKWIITKDLHGEVHQRTLHILFQLKPVCIRTYLFLIRWHMHWMCHSTPVCHDWKHDSS